MDDPDLNAPDIAAEGRQDAAGVYAVHESAFGRTDEAELVVALRAEGAVLVSLVARAGEMVVGHVLFTRLEVEAAGARAPAVSLAPLAVSPRFQRRGVGARLVRAGLARLEADGEALVHVLGHPDYYPRFGFSAEAARGLDCPFGDGPASMALALAPDAPISGRLIYAAAFGGA